MMKAIRLPITILGEIFDSRWFIPVLLAAVAAVALFGLVGCQSYSYRAPDGTVLTINRAFTDAQIGKLTASAPNGTTLTVEGLKSETQQLVEQLIAALLKEVR